MADVLKQSDQLFDTYKFRESYELLQRQSDRSYETLWRLARVIYSLSREVQHDASKRKQHKALIIEGLDYAKCALELQPGCSAANKYYALFLAEKCAVEGFHKRIMKLGTILIHMQRATELDASDLLMWFVLGRFYQQLVGLPRFQKKQNHTVTPDVQDPTLRDALQPLEKARTVHSNVFPFKYVMLCVMYARNKARRFLQLTANQTTVSTGRMSSRSTAEDEEAQPLLKKL